jgi:hypothetical protein
VADLLLSPYRAGLAARCPAARIAAPIGSPLDGAARLLTGHQYGDLVTSVAR